MDIDPAGFYEVLSPRTTALITTVDNDGQVNAAPFSFITPVSFDPPLLLFSANPARHTLANAKETGDFVLNVAPENILNKLMICSKALPKGVSELEEAGLTPVKSHKVKSPSIKECVSWIECLFESEVVAGDHVLVIGRVVHASCRTELLEGDEFKISAAKPVLHVRGKRFVVAERVIKADSK